MDLDPLQRLVNEWLAKALMQRRSLLEMLHPEGHASTTFVLGGNCPQSLFAESSKAAHQGIALLILAPTTDECRYEGWLEGAAGFVSQHLSKDGLCYLLVPLPWRWKIIRLLRNAHLEIGSSFWHFPDWTSTQYLVPLQPGPARFAVDHMITGPFWKRSLAKELLRLSGVNSLLGATWKSAGISVRRPGARPVFQWLFNRDQHEPRRGTAIIRRSWRGAHGADVLYCFAERDVSPAVVVKTTFASNSLACIDHEAEVLDLLGSDVRSSGAQLPQVLLKREQDRRSSLFLSPLRGKSASDLLTSNPDLLRPLITKLVDWLERWHVASLHVRPANMHLLEKDVFAPIEQLASSLENAVAYRDWLADRIRSIAGSPVPFVATHNDLTMANVLVDDSKLGVVDWETGQAESWPLVDFYYAVTDAVMIAGQYTNRLEAFKDCYQRNSLYGELVQSCENQLQSAIGISSDLVELAFHACWLHHAANEGHVSKPGDPRPFLEIVQWLALNYTKLTKNYLR